MKLFKFELKKIFLNKRTLIMFLVLAAVYIGLGIGNSFFTFRGDSDYKGYKDLADEVVGPYNEEFAKEAKARIKEISKYVEGDHFLESTCSKNNQDKLYYSYYKYMQVYDKESAKNPNSTDLPEFENTVLWEAAYEGWEDMMILILMMFPLAFIVAPVFTREVSTGMDNIILSSVNGRRKILAAKLGAVAVTAISLTTLYFLGTFIGGFAPYMTFDGYKAPISTLGVMSNSTLDVSVGTFTIITYLWACAAAVAFGVIASLISSLFKNQASVFGLGILILLLGIILNAFGSTFVEKVQSIIDLSFTNTVGATSIFNSSKTFDLFSLSLSYQTAALLVFAVSIVGGIILLFLQQKKRTIA